MEIIEIWLAVLGLLLMWGSSLITIWIKFNIKLKEIEIKMNQNTKMISELDARTNRINESILDLAKENRSEQKELKEKLDKILESFNDFRVLMEKRLLQK